MIIGLVESMLEVMLTTLFQSGWVTSAFYNFIIPPANKLYIGIILSISKILFFVYSS